MIKKINFNHVLREVAQAYVLKELWIQWIQIS